MDRQTVFNSLATHPWLGRVYKKLTIKERLQCEVFLVLHTGSDKDRFELAVNRMFLDDPEKPKHYKEMLELLTCANSLLK